MGREEQFDSFYAGSRRSLVLQTFALTADLPAAHAAVRDAYTSAWQHWRKVSALEDPMRWVRPKAWQLAQRRHDARLRRRNEALSTAHNAVLDAIGNRPSSQRNALLLTHLAALTPRQVAHEMGITPAAAEALSDEATDGFATDLGVDPERVPSRLLSLSIASNPDKLPRGPVLRRAGTHRRHSSNAIAVAAATATAIAAGAFAYQVPHDDVATRTPPPTAVPSQASEDVDDGLPSPDKLLDEDQITRLGLDQDWRVTDTHDNTQGRGINTTSQQERFADPDGISALVRNFEAKGKPRRSAVQTMEVSESAAQARKAYRTTVGWYAGCQVGRLQLLTAYRVDNIGDRADALLLRVWEKPVTTYSVAVARTGRFVTSTVGETVGAKTAPPSEIAQSLADSVAMVCPVGGFRDCSERPSVAVVPPPPSGEERGILAVADLPPVGAVQKHWVGTDASPTRINPSATICDRADFADRGAQRTRTRTFLIPDAKLPDRFGLSETYGVFRSPTAAASFLREIRGRMSRCEDRNPAAAVSEPRSVHPPRSPMDSSVWELDTEISDDASVLFRLGFVRAGDTVTQVTFSPTVSQDMPPARFDALVARAGDRLRELERPESGR